MPRPTKSSTPSPPTRCKPPPPCDPAQLNQVYKWVLSGVTEADIGEAVRQSWPDAHARPLIVAAAAQLAAAADFDPAIVAGWCIEATRDLYRRMVEIGDFAGALRAVKQLHDLTGPG